MPSVAHVLVLLLGAALAARQPDAAALLASAARYQRGDEPRGAPSSLHGVFHVTGRDEQGAKTTARVERWYTREPERMLTLQQETVTDAAATEGWDGETAWYERNGKVVRYSDDPQTWDTDLERHEEQLRLTRLLLESSVLDALIPQLEGARVAAEARHVDLDGSPHRVAVVEARAPRRLVPDERTGAWSGASASPPPPPPPPGAAAGEGESAREAGSGETGGPEAAGGAAGPGGDGDEAGILLRLLVDLETGALWGLDVVDPRASPVPVWRLRFDFHGRTAAGLRVPGNVRLFRGDEPAESASLGVAESDGGHLIFEIDEPIDPAIFAPPRG